MKATKFRVQNFKNVDDSGWIPLERVTAFVGRNESGKTAILKALHKFNPATSEPYDPQREFPRDRYTRDFVAQGSRGEYWPVCSVEFELDASITASISEDLPEGMDMPKSVVCTRYYDGSLTTEFIPSVEDHPITSDAILTALSTFASTARRLPVAEGETEDDVAPRRQTLANWATEWSSKLSGEEDLRTEDGIKVLTDLRNEANGYSSPQTADMVETLLHAVEPIIEEAQTESVTDQLDEILDGQIPVFIYFENYGILDSTIWLPRFIQDLKANPSDARVRTVNAMFQHVGLDAAQVMELGSSTAEQQRHQGTQPTDDTIADNNRMKDERAIKLNSASIDISTRFSQWWSQRRHKIRYHADGDYFRIWIADDRRPDVEIELEERSKGFQWFFSFYLVFLVESQHGHKDAILLLDEPGLDLHPTAQQELIEFFEKLADANQLLYTTHSPFLIDGGHIHRVRPVTEDENGLSRVSVGEWPKDRETIFPLQAAAGYAMLRGLFQHKRNILVEGMSDYYYLHALSQQCLRSNRISLPDNVYITPCGGTKHMGYIASLFLGQDIRPLVLLDGDDAGRARRDSLMKELYAGHNDVLLMLDDVLGRSEEQVEIEDVLGESILLPALSAVCGKAMKLSEADRKAGSLPDQIKASAERKSLALPKGWKASVAIGLVSSWAEAKTTLPDPVLDAAEKLFEQITNRFGQDA